MRMGIIPLSLAKKNKKNLKEFYETMCGFAAVVSEPTVDEALEMVEALAEPTETVARTPAVVVEPTETVARTPRDEDLIRSEMEYSHGEDYYKDSQIALSLQVEYSKRVPHTERDIHICLEDCLMSRVVSKDKSIVLRVDKDCWCYACPPVGHRPAEEPTRIPITYAGKPITNQTCCEALVRSNWVCCNHIYVEGFLKPDENGEVVVALGS